MPASDPSSPPLGVPGFTAPFVPVIPAGGAGTRLWPLSRRERPKFLLDLTGAGSTLLQQTLERVQSLADRAPLLITGAAHADAVAEQAAGRARVLAEPSPRDSMPAIALAAAVAEREDEDCVIGSFAADHLITDAEGFARSVAVARQVAELGYLVTLGVEPTGPATCFGYIERSDAAQAPADGAPAAPLPPLAGTGAHAVTRFVEKPDRERAESFLATGRFLWNAGMFVAGARMLLDALAEQIPPLARGAREIAAAIGTDREQQVLARVWPELTAIAIDHALAEPLARQGRVAVVPAAFDWDDVGDYAALARQLREQQGARDVAVLGDAEVLGLGSRATVYSSSERPIALLGLDDVSVVETEDVMLVIADRHAQSLAGLVGGLGEAGHGELR